MDHDQLYLCWSDMVRAAPSQPQPPPEGTRVFIVVCVYICNYPPRFFRRFCTGNAGGGGYRGGGAFGRPSR